MGNVCQDSVVEVECEGPRTVDDCTNTYFITSHRGKQLEDRGGAVGVHDDEGGWQKWTLSDAGDNRVFTTSHRGKQLEDRGGAVGVHDDKGGWQKWTLRTYNC